MLGMRRVLCRAHSAICSGLNSAMKNRSNKTTPYLLAGATSLAGAAVISGMSCAVMESKGTWFHKPWTSYQTEILLPELVGPRLIIGLVHIRLY